MTMFIGPKPANTPKYVYPFTASDGHVYDANGVDIVALDLPTFEDDAEMAKAIADALNAKFAATTTEPEGNAEVFSYEGVRPTDNDVWFVVEDRAYYRQSSGALVRSVFSPQELRRGAANLVPVGRTYVDPADLTGVEGKA
ncbi:hypothetical protein ACWEF6_01775 [Amycolatopsis sp. NPDC004772]